MIRRTNRVGFTLIELLLVVSIIAILVAIALPNYIKIKDKAKEAETKANLHNIQLNVERFAVDHEGIYPNYLIGGDNEWMDITLGQDDELRPEFHDIPAEECSDQLLRDGYVESYPRNPFIKEQLPVMQMQGQVGDALRSAYPEGRGLGTRFGARGNVMGEALCDARWLTWNYNDMDHARVVERNTWSNVDYGFYDVWLGNMHKPHLPGEFLYKSIGEIVANGGHRHTAASLAQKGKNVALNDPDNPDVATIPLSTSSYMLGAWGGTRTKGMDLLGEEPLVIFSVRTNGSGGMPPTNIPYVPVAAGMLPGMPLLPPSIAQRVEVFGVPPWTRGVNRSHVGPLWGSPYGAAQNASQQLSSGNPNGCQDSIILWLSPAGDGD
jgi:prepilin-type N-terminal cleavage/methylation domain-containing protein